MKKKKFRGRLIGTVVFLAAALLLAAMLWKLSDNSEFETTFYRVTSDKIGDSFRIVLLSDLHNSEFGEKNRELTEEIKRLKPDLILMAGDMVNDDDPDVSIVTDLCGTLREVAPVYYGLGNHEGNLMYLETGYQIPLDSYLFEAGVTVLYNNSVSAEIKGNDVEIGVAATNPDNFEELSSEFISEFEKKDGFKILISHYPTLYYDCLADAEIDLAVAGHFHGGLIRLPGGRGLFHRDTGFFPRYCYGEFKLEHGNLIVSRGLGNHGKIPRINNRPELVVINVSHT